MTAYCSPLAVRNSRGQKEKKSHKEAGVKKWCRKDDSWSRQENALCFRFHDDDVCLKSVISN